MKIICYGDSNTYGYDAASFLGSRFPSSDRWTDLLEEALWERELLDRTHQTEGQDLPVASVAPSRVIGAGMNGREIPCDDYELDELITLLEREAPFDQLLIMLGSNDLLLSLKGSLSPVEKRMRAFLDQLMAHPLLAGCPEKLLLIAPTPVHLGAYGGAAFDASSEHFAEVYRQIAADFGCRFADAGSFGIPLAGDGVHFTAEGHHRFAKEIGKIVMNDL